MIVWRRKTARSRAQPKLPTSKSARLPHVVARLAAVAAFVLVANAAYADHAPTIVVPGRPFTQVTRNGVDVRGAVIEGEWGLYRPGHGTVTVYGGWAPLDRPYGGYFPATGRPPRYGRDEVVPRHRRTAPTESFRRVWSSESRSDVPYSPPSVIEAPVGRGR